MPGPGQPDPPDRGHRQAGPRQRGRDLLRAGPLRYRARDVADRQADRAAHQQRDQERDDGRVRGAHELDDGVDPHRHPERVPPGGPADQDDHGGVGDQGGQVRIQGLDVADPGMRHDDRVVEPAGHAAPQQQVDGLGHQAGQHPGQHRLGQPPRLAPHQLLDGQRHGQAEQRDHGQRGGRLEQGVRQPPAHAHEVDLHAGGGRARRDAGDRQADELDAGDDAAQQVDRLADPALQVIGDLDRTGLRWHHGTIVPSWPPSGIDGAPPARHEGSLCDLGVPGIRAGNPGRPTGVKRSCLLERRVMARMTYRSRLSRTGGRHVSSGT